MGAVPKTYYSESEWTKYKRLAVMDAMVCYSDPSPWIETIIPSAASNIGSRWLSDGSLFCCPQLKSHSVQAHRQPTANNWSMPKYECPVLFEPRQDRVPHRIGEPTFVVTTLPFNSSSVQSYCLHTFAGIESLGTLQKASCMWISTSESVSGGLSMQQFIVFLFCFVVNSKVYPSTSLCVTII